MNKWPNRNLLNLSQPKKRKGNKAQPSLKSFGKTKN